MAKQPSGRGSVKLSAAASAIKKRLKGVKVIDWHEVGTPHPEVVIGTVQTGERDAVAADPRFAAWRAEGRA